jgi:hypothetical protein
LAVVGLEHLDRRAERLDQAHQHPVSDGALVGLDLREVADRNAQFAGAGFKSPPSPLSERAHLRADEKLVAHFAISQTRRGLESSLRTNLVEHRGKTTLVAGRASPSGAPWAGTPQFRRPVRVASEKGTMGTL